LSKAHNWKSIGNDQIQNYWLTAFPAVHRHITKNFNGLMEEPEKVPEWLTTEITYLLPKLGDSKEVRNYHVQNLNRNNSQNNFHTFGRAELTTSRTKMMLPWM
jgi:hypothetical protein